MGTANSRSYVSFSVSDSQKVAESARKNKNNRISLLVLVNRNSQIARHTLRMVIRGGGYISLYFCVCGVLEVSLKTEPLSTVMTTSRAIFTSTVFLARSMLFTVP